MKLTNKAKVYFTAIAAAASFLCAAPVTAAEYTNNEITIREKGPVFQEMLNLGMSGYGNFDSAVAKKSGLSEENGKKIFKDAYGQELTDLVEDNGNQYFLQEDGTLATGWVKNHGGWYYFDQEGVRQTGLIEDEGKEYLLASDGSLTKGWVEDNGSWTFYTKDGSKAENTTITIEGVNYKFDENGSWVKPEANAEVTPAEYAQEITADMDRYQMIANAAIAQIGRYQDCTMLVTNALRAVGINHHGAPASYLSLGTITNNPVPGDIIVYQGHVAIYIGNDRAIHGGFLGNQTVEWSVACTNAFVAYVHPRLP